MKLFLPNFIALFIGLVITNAVNAQYQYISPVPGSKLHNPEETVILRNGDAIDALSLQKKHLFSLTGSISGNHAYEIKLVEHNRTIILQPAISFAEGETVTVRVGEGVKTEKGRKLSATTFSFSIRPVRSVEQKQQIAGALKEVYEEEFGKGGSDHFPMLNGASGFPNFSILTNTNPVAGEVFWHNFSLLNNQNSHICITENNGDSVYGKFDTVSFNNYDLNHNGYITVYNRLDSSYMMLDSNYTKITELFMGNGYRADVHELQIFPDRNRYMVAYDAQIVDMTVYNPTYNPNATVIGCVIQELDSLGNVLFQWRSWDHLVITDADHINLALGIIDYCHCNSIEKDADGNLIISFRHLSEVLKVNRTTGDIMWTLGGKNNEFSFTNDADKFSWQHDARRLANGHLTLFDNGNYHTPARSWAKEYQLDEVNKTVTLVWSYSRNVNGANLFSTAMGSVQRLSAGHTLICWGLTYQTNMPNITELDSMGNVVWELQVTGSGNTMYRAHRYTWDPCSRPSLAGEKVKNITASTAKVTWDPATNATSYELRYRVTGTQSWTTKHNITNTYKKLKDLLPNTKYDYEVRSKCSVNSPSAWTFIKTFTTKPQREGLAGASVSAEVILFPNPAHQTVQVRMYLQEETDITLTIFDLSGKVISNTIKHGDAGACILPLDIHSFNSGNYLVKICTPEWEEVQKLTIGE